MSIDLKWNMLNCHELIEEAASIDEAAKMLAEEFRRVIDAWLLEDILQAHREGREL